MEARDQVAKTAAELTSAMARLRARLRAESEPRVMPWTWSQLTILGRIIENGPTTVSDLARAEHVRRQSMAETVAVLRADGLIGAEPDPDDRRKAVISVTEKGLALSTTIPAAREKWLAATMAELLDSRECEVLLEAASIVNRIAQHKD
ncbi:DNA-binding MarR family transcriptional regulator [Rhodococcus sp. 27YEA15]|uniref:MarR family winged helix-turn-helix transcriptional regulator n=1 Tax=Rhodococcus sp. 27YEA15 TaxID=3156259 RepID=UPI003C7ED65B